MSSVRASARWTAVVVSFEIATCALPADHPVRGEQPLPQVERLKSSPVLRHLRSNPIAAPAQSAEGQLESLNDRERLELLKLLMTN